MRHFRGFLGNIRRRAIDNRKLICRIRAKAVAISLFVMAKRRWQKPRKRKSSAICVEASTAYVVPFTSTRSYYRTEITNEGFRRSGCTPIVLFPRAEVGEAT